MPKLKFTRYVILGSLLLLGCFFVTQKSNAEIDGGASGFLLAARHGVSDSTSQSTAVYLNDFINYQAFYVETSNQEVHGHGITSKYKYIYCLSPTSGLWQGPCRIVEDNDYSQSDGVWRYPAGKTFEPISIDPNDSTDYKAVVAEIYVMDAEARFNFRVYGRRPSIDSLGAFSDGSPVTNVRVNQEIEVRWSVSDANNVLMEWVVPGLGEGAPGGLSPSGSMRFTPSAAGTASFRIRASGIGGLGRTQTIEQVINVQVEGTMTGNLTTNMDGQGRRCTLDASAQNCHIQVSWNTSNATTISIHRNGAAWVGPTGSASGMQRHDDPVPGSYTYTLYGTAGPQTLQLDQATVVIEPYTPGAPPPPPPPGAPSCNPGSQTIAIGGTANFTASGGNGSFTWSAPYGSPASGSGSSFAASYNASGFRQVTVTSGGQSAVCNVNISSAPPPGDQPPVGLFESVDNSACTIDGWTADPDAPSTPIEVHVYQGGPFGTGTGVGAYTTNVYRGNVGYSTGNHGFSLTMPGAFRDGASRSLYVYGINSSPGGSSTLLSGSPRTIACTPPAIPPCQETFTIANTPNGISDYAVFGNANYDIWVSDPYAASTNASNFDRSASKLGLSTRAGSSYTAGQSRGVAIHAPAGGTIQSISFHYQTNSYDPNFAQMSIDYTGVSPFWFLNASGNLDTRSGALTTVTFPGNGVQWAGLYYYIANSNGSAPFSFADFYDVSMVVSRPCNPTVSITADSVNLNSGQSTLVRWSVNDANALSANITPSPGAVYLTSPPGHGGSGTFTTGAMSSARTYTITATRWDNGQPMSASVTINVNTSGSVNISCNGPSTAYWNVHSGGQGGPIVATGSPTGSIHNLPAGPYWLAFSVVPGWTTPTERAFSIGAGSPTNISGCDYTQNQASIQVNSISNRTNLPLSGAWNISGTGGVNRNRTGTSFTESDLVPNNPTPYTITPQALASCVAGESYGTPAPSSVNTSGAGTTVNSTIAYLQGQFSIHSTVSGGSWSISPNPSGCTGTGNGTGTVTYYRAPGNYTITAPTIAGFNAPVIKYGSGSYSSPHVLNVTSGSNTAITIEYSAPPPTPPTNLQFSVATCNTINISWLDNSTNETGFNIYYRNTSSGANNFIKDVGAAAGTGTRPSYLWTAPPAGNLWIVVAAYVDYGGGNIVEGASTPTGPIAKLACSPNLTGSAKTLIAINGTAYTSSSVIRDGDTLTFRITVVNGGTDKALVTTIADTLSGNLARPSGGWNLRVDLNANGVYNSGGAENSVNATGTDDPTININRNKCTTNNNNGCLPAEDPACVTSPIALCNNWVFLIDAVVTAAVPNVRTEVGNEAFINYDYPVGSGSNDDYFVEAGPYLVQTIRPRVPQFREITP